MKKLSVSSTYYLKIYTWKQQKLLRFKDKDFILFLFDSKNIFPAPPNCLLFKYIFMTLLKSTLHLAV